MLIPPSYPHILPYKTASHLIHRYAVTKPFTHSFHCLRKDGKTLLIMLCRQIFKGALQSGIELLFVIGKSDERDAKTSQTDILSVHLILSPLKSFPGEKMKRFYRAVHIRLFHGWDFLPGIRDRRFLLRISVSLFFFSRSGGFAFLRTRSSVSAGGQT